MLAAYTGSDKKDWSDYIDLCVCAYNTSIYKNTKATPHEAMFGRTARSSFSSLMKQATL